MKNANSTMRISPTTVNTTQNFCHDVSSFSTSTVCTVFCITVLSLPGMNTVSEGTLKSAIRLPIESNLNRRRAFSDCTTSNQESTTLRITLQQSPDGCRISRLEDRYQLIMYDDLRVIVGSKVFPSLATEKHRTKNNCKECKNKWSHNKFQPDSTSDITAGTPFSTWDIAAAKAHMVALSSTSGT